MLVEYRRMEDAYAAAAKRNAEDNLYKWGVRQNPKTGMFYVATMGFKN